LALYTADGVGVISLYVHALPV